MKEPKENNRLKNVIHKRIKAKQKYMFKHIH